MPSNSEADEFDSLEGEKYHWECSKEIKEPMRKHSQMKRVLPASRRGRTP